MLFNTPAEKDSANEALPAGEYRVIVEKTDWKQTKAGNGNYASITFAVVQGPYQGKKVFGIFNLVNPNATAERIGKAEFKRFLNAIGVQDPIRDEHDMARLCTKKVLWIEVENETYNGELQAKVKSYSAQPKSAGLAPMPLVSPRSVNAQANISNDPTIPPF